MVDPLGPSEREKRERRGRGAVSLFHREYAMSNFAGAIFLVVVFGGFSVAGIVVGIVLLTRQNVGAGVGAIVGGGVFLTVVFAPRLRREERGIDLGDDRTLTDGTPPGWDRFTSQVEDAFDGTPYRVTISPESVRVCTDLEDPRVRARVSGTNPPRQFPGRLVTLRGDGKVAVTGLPVDVPRVRTAPDLSVFDRKPGEAEEPTASSPDGAASDGFTFRGREVARPVNAALRANRLRRFVSAGDMIGIVMGGFGILVAVGTGIALVIVGLLGGFE
jgi:hypothetical protein